MHGIVKWFDPRRGFGFITADDGRDFFVHQTNIQIDGFRKLFRTQEVAFEPSVDANGRDMAINVVPQPMPPREEA